MTAGTGIIGIGNLILTVRDMERSLAFYRDILGLPVRFATPELAFLLAGAVALCLRSAAAAAATEAVAATGERQVELVFDVPDIHAAYQALKARGVVFRVEPRLVTGDRWATDFRDPDGYLLSIFGPAAEEDQA